MIEIINLSVFYKNTDRIIKAIEGINLEINKGEILSVVGPSGGGKSTLLKVLAGIIQNYEGQVLIDRKRVDPKLHRIGFIPQNYGLVKWKSIEENIFLSARIKDGRKSVDREFYKKIIKQLNIEDIINRYPNQLSGGQMQRVSIARALLLKPNLLLMDESFSALDAMTREEVRNLFMEVWKEHRVTTVLITHDINEAIYMGMKIAAFSSGPGRILKVFENPLFGKGCLSHDREFRDLNNNIRTLLKGVSTDETKGI